MEIGIILGSIRAERAGESVARWVAEQAAPRVGARYELLDLSSSDVRGRSAVIDAYDAFVVVTPEYHHSVPGGLKDAVGSLGEEWAYKPVGFVSYGAEGGVRAVGHWRRIVADFHMHAVPQQLSLSLFSEFGPEGFRPAEGRPAELAVLFDQLENATGRVLAAS